MIDQQKAEWVRKNDADLVMLYQSSSDQRILAILYERYLTLIYGVCLKYLKDSDLARDEVVNIYLQLVNKVKNHNIYDFKNWLYRLVQNHCLMILRQAGKINIDYSDQLNMQSDSFVHLDYDDMKENKLAVMEKCLETLSDDQRTAVDLFYLQSFSYKEIAQKTGYQESLVRSFIQNGKRNLKNCMEKLNAPD